MNFLPVTENLITILVKCARQLRDTSYKLENDPVFLESGDVADTIKLVVEESFQQAAVLDDIVRRYKESK